MRLRRLRRARSVALAALLLGAAMAAVVDEVPAYGDAHAPPAFPTSCPGPSGPPAGYFNPTPSQPNPPVTYTGPAYHGPIPYEVPFKGVIGLIQQGTETGGFIHLPPQVKIPNLFASVCGLVQLPQLSGTLVGGNINLATPNIYVAGLEALPASVKFGTLKAAINLKPAHNGGLDITLSGSTTAGVSTLGMTCSITLNASFSTLQGTGTPVTGPSESGQAILYSNSFPVPAAQSSTTCPAPIAQTFNKLLDLPAKPGVGTFVAPFCFDFELEGINNPSSLKNPSHPTQALNPNCPWPSH